MEGISFLHQLHQDALNSRKIYFPLKLAKVYSFPSRSNTLKSAAGIPGRTLLSFSKLCLTSCKHKASNPGSNRFNTFPVFSNPRLNTNRVTNCAAASLFLASARKANTLSMDCINNFSLSADSRRTPAISPSINFSPIAIFNSPEAL